MTTTLSKRAWAISLFTAFALSIGATSAHAQEAATQTATVTVPVPSRATPGMIGAQTIAPGSLVLGAATGFPETQLRAIFGLGSNFDLGVFAGFTYGNARLSGLQQGIGLDLQVPIRWRLFELPHAAMALRIVPFFRIGKASPAFSFGGLVGARFSFPLPKIFSIVVGPEARVGFASYGDSPNRVNGFDGAVYGVLGLEAFVNEHWHFNLQFDGGGYFSSGSLGNGGLVNVMIGMGYQLH